ncbi:hypothetical protein [Bacillus albus]|uniref:hypothetical protein n=1 Tax=Bacillus albus TaxID=2026189 RepID=UPI0030144B34
MNLEWEAAKVLVSSALEKDAKRMQVKDIMNYVEKCTNIIIDTIRTRDLNEFKSNLENFQQNFEDLLITDIGEDVSPYEPDHPLLHFFIPLKDDINALKTGLNWYFKEQDMNFFAHNVYPILLNTVALETAVLMARKRKLKDYSADWIILKHCYEYFLETHHRVEQFMYEQIMSLTVGLLNTEYNKKKHKNYAVNQIKKFIATRNHMENERYRMELQLNHNFEVNELPGDHQYSLIRRHLCTNALLKEYEVKYTGKSETKRVLAVNNHNGEAQLPHVKHPSISKDALDIPEGALTNFEVIFRSEKPDRRLEIAIYEIDTFNQVIVDQANTVVDYSQLINQQDEFTMLRQEYTKQKAHSRIRFELYWCDHEEKDLIISEYNVDYTVQEMPWYPENTPEGEHLPIIAYPAWGFRCSERHLIFTLDKDLRTTQVLLANDHKSEYPVSGIAGPPSITSDFILKKIDLKPLGQIYEAITTEIPGWDALNVRFEATLRTDIDIGRQVELKIYEFSIDPDNGRITIQHSYSSGRVGINEEWVHLSVECKKQSIQHIRCEIYWFDNENVDTHIRDANVTYF